MDFESPPQKYMYLTERQPKPQDWMSDGLRLPESRISGKIKPLGQLNPDWEAGFLGPTIERATFHRAFSHPGIRGFRETDAGMCHRGLLQSNYIPEPEQPILTGRVPLGIITS